VYKRQVLLQPHISLPFSAFKLTGGISGIYDGSSWQVRPLVEASYTLDYQTTIAAGFKSEIINQHLFRQLTINPFQDIRRDSLFGTQRDILYLSLNGALEQVNFQVQVDYSWLNNEVLYLNDFSDRRFFNVLNDNGNVWNVGLSASRKIYKSISLTTVFDYRNYSMDNALEAYHLPTLSWTISPSATLLDDKLRVELQGRLLGGINAFPVSDQDVVPFTLPAIFDVSLGAEYFITEHIGAYTHLNNILNQKNARWQYYDQIGFNVHGGVLVRF